jgi:fructose-1,6-bisphosphatase I
MRRHISLDEFIISKQQDFQYASGDLTRLLRDLGLAAKIVSREVNKAGLADISGTHGTQNASGETVMKLDMLADDMLISCLQNSGEVCGIGSEENEDFVTIKQVGDKESKYVVLFDPLDGSSNIDVNISIGTIFGIYRRVSSNCPVKLDDFLQKGNELVAAGYVIYGSSTMLVYTTGNGVNGFTLDPSIGEFCLSHPDIKIPTDGKVYSTNQGNYNKYVTPAKQFIDYCVNQSWSLRYVGTMVSDVHRTLLKGGIFMYPATQTAPNGKLRLLYECNPLSFIVEQAGGKASDGFKRILDIQPTELHQRTSIFIGSKNMVEKAELFMSMESRS